MGRLSRASLRLTSLFKNITWRRLFAFLLETCASNVYSVVRPHYRVFVCKIPTIHIRTEELLLHSSFYEMDLLYIFRVLHLFTVMITQDIITAELQKSSFCGKSPLIHFKTEGLRALFFSTYSIYRDILWVGFRNKLARNQFPFMAILTLHRIRCSYFVQPESKG